MRVRLTLIATMMSAAVAVAGEFSFSVKNAKNEPVSDAVVSLVPVDATAPLPPAKPAELDQHDQEYSAYVTVIQAGATIAFPNKDTVQHHIYSLSKAKKFELPLYNPGAVESYVFDVSGVVTLGCNIHDWMLAYVLVVPTPYFAKSNETGTAKISAPNGSYHLELWHPRLANVIKQEITLADGAPLQQEFSVTLKADRRVRRGPESKSGGYR